MTTKIEWADHVWNPVTGCSHVSEGCRYCYAEREFPRLAGNPKTPAYHDRTFTDVACHPDRLGEPLKRKKPARYFVNSMSDLFHPDVPVDFIDDVFAVMAFSRGHTFQVLTKRPERMFEYLRDFDVRGFCDLAFERGFDVSWPLPNVWLGVSVEDQKTADERIPILLQCPAAIRWVSYEPALSEIDLAPWLICDTMQEKNGEDHERERNGVYGAGGAWNLQYKGKRDYTQKCPICGREQARNTNNAEVAGDPEKGGDLRVGRVSEDNVHPCQSTLFDKGSQGGMDVFQPGTNSRKAPNQPQKRGSQGQQAGESGGSDLAREHYPRRGSSEEPGEKESAGGKEHKFQVDAEASHRYPHDVEKSGNEPTCSCQNVWGRTADDLKHLQKENLETPPRINWIVAGGESGPNARPADPDWFRRVRDDCKAAEVKFFMKQMHKKGPIPDDLMIREFPGVNHW